MVAAGRVTARDCAQTPRTFLKATKLLENKKEDREEGRAESSTTGERWTRVKGDGGWPGVDWERGRRCQDVV